jgi:hypothetical protein
MMADLKLETYDVRLIDFNKLFTSIIQYNIVNNLHDLECLHKSISNRLVKKIFLHWVIFEMCEKILDKNEKSVVYFNYTQIEECDILKYYKENDILNFLSYSLRRVEKLLPVKIYISKYSIDYLSHLLSKKDGKAYTTVNSIITKMNNIDITKFTFSGVKKFTKQYELSFLNNDYFNRLSTKQLMLK